VAALALALAGCAEPDGSEPGLEPAAPAADVGADVPVPPLHPEIDDWDAALVRVVGRNLEVAVRVATTPGQRSRGLMGVPSLPDGAGMLFVFERPWSGGFWMRDTLVPLDIAFAEANGTIVAVDSMIPCTADPCPLHDPGISYRAALEVPAGWLEANGVGPGDRLAW
jgi:uncharacterized protein